MRLSEKIRRLTLFLAGERPADTILDRVFNTWEYPEILADLDELCKDRSGPSERAYEVLDLDCSTAVGRYCHVLVDLVEACRIDWQHPLLESAMRMEGIEPEEGTNECNAMELMFIALFG